MKKDKKFAFYTFTNPTTGDTRRSDMPWSDWERIQRDRSRKPNFVLDRIVDLDKPEETVSSNEPSIMIQEDELECPLCGFIATDDDQLQSHKHKKHGQI